MRFVIATACAALLLSACPPPPSSDAGADGGAPGEDGGEPPGEDAGPGFDAGPPVATDNSCTNVTPAALPDGGPALTAFTSAEVPGVGAGFTAPQLSPDGRSAVLVNPNAQQALHLDLQTGVRTFLPGDDDLSIYGAYNVRYSDDGRWVTFWTTSNSVVELRAQRSDLSAPPVALVDNQSAQVIAFAPDGESVLVNGYPITWEIDLTTLERRTISNETTYFGFYAPDGQTLLLTGPSGVRVIDLDSLDATALGQGRVLQKTLTSTDVAIANEVDGVLYDVSFASPDEPTVVAEDVRIFGEGGDGSVYFRAAGGGPLQVWRRGDSVRELSRDVPEDFRISPDGTELLYLRGTTPDVELRALDTTGERDAPWLLLERPLRDLDAAIAGLAAGKPDAFLVHELLPSGREIVRRAVDGCTDDVVLGPAVLCTTRSYFRGLESDAFAFLDGCDGDLTTAQSGGLVPHPLGVVPDEVYPVPGTDRVFVRHEGGVLLAGPGVLPFPPAPGRVCGAPPAGDAGVPGDAGGDAGAADAGPGAATYSGDELIRSARQIDLLHRAGYTVWDGDLELQQLSALDDVDLSCLQEVTGRLTIRYVVAPSIDLSSLRRVGELLIEFNNGVQQIDLSALESVNGPFRVYNNFQLPQCDVDQWVANATISGSVEAEFNQECVDAGP